MSKHKIISVEKLVIILMTIKRSQYLFSRNPQRFSFLWHYQLLAINVNFDD